MEAESVKRITMLISKIIPCFYFFALMQKSNKKDQDLRKKAKNLDVRLK